MLATGHDTRFIQKNVLSSMLYIGVGTFCNELLLYRPVCITAHIQNIGIRPKLLM
jgi:hypothetical protein